MRSRFWLATGLAITVGVGGCQFGAPDKTGSTTVVLRLATVDLVNDNGQSFGPQAFVDNLTKVSGGRLKLQLITTYGDGAPDAEVRMVRAIASGDLDGGWPTSRVFARAGFPGLTAVEAPLTITSYAAEKAIASGPIAARLLKSLDGTGIDALGLAVGPLRRPFAARQPLLGPDDWKGARIRSTSSPVQRDVFRALGATPVDLSFSWSDEVAAGTMRGAEFDVAQYASNNLGATAGQITSNVVLWPKMYVLIFSRKRMDALSHQQQSWVRQAAQLAVKASVDATYNDSAFTKELCASGAKFTAASDQQLTALHRAVQPTIDQMASDPAVAPVLHDIQTLAATYPTDTIDSAPACNTSDSVGPLGVIPNSPSALPSGVYRVQISQAEVAAAGQNNHDGASGIWTLTVEGGTYRLTCRPSGAPGRDCGQEVVDTPLEAGTLRGSGHSVYFVYDASLLSRLSGCQLPASNTQPGHCWDGIPFRMTWSLTGQTLRFTDFHAQAAPDWQYLLKPWQKIS